MEQMDQKCWFPFASSLPQQKVSLEWNKDKALSLSSFDLKKFTRMQRRVERI